MRLHYDWNFVYLLAGYSGVSIGGCSEDEVVEYGSVGRHPDATAHHHCHLELVPVLVTAAEWTLDPVNSMSNAFISYSYYHKYYNFNRNSACSYKKYASLCLLEIWINCKLFEIGPNSAGILAQQLGEIEIFVTEPNKEYLVFFVNNEAKSKKPMYVKLSNSTLSNRWKK